MPLRIGDDAPDFEAPDQARETHRLSDYRGEWAVLYFYPEDETSGCTAEACGFRDMFEEFEGQAVILGISPDSMESHEKFALHHGLPFTLLADPDRKIHALYGVATVFHKRTTFLIDPDGKIVQIYDRVVPEAHAEEVLKEVKAQSV